MGSYNFVSNNRPTPQTDHKSPEKRLWKAVLNLAIEEGLGLFTTYMCDYEKNQARLFLQRRSKEFDELCERVDLDANLAWKEIQKFKLIQSGIIRPSNKKERLGLEVVSKIQALRKGSSYVR